MPRGNKPVAPIAEALSAFGGVAASLETERRVAQRALDRAAEKLAYLESLPEDPFEDGTVLWFRKQFHPKGFAYTYALLKVGNLWYSTGHGARTWPAVLEFLRTGVDEVWWAVEWEKVADESGWFE